MDTLLLLPPPEQKNHESDHIKTIKLSESDLILGIRNSNKNALDTLYKMYSGALYGIIIRIVNEKEFAADVLQDTFVRIWQSFDLYNEKKGRLYTWMSNIARNLALDQIKLKRNRNNAKNEDIDYMQHVVDSQYNVSNNPDIIGIRQMARELRPKYRCIIELLYFKGYTQQEASKELNIPMGTLKTRLRAAVNEMREYFSEGKRLIAV